MVSDGRQDVVAVVGACAPERRRHAARLAAGSLRELIPAFRLERSSDPVQHALQQCIGRARGVVVEFPALVAATDIIAAFDGEDQTRLAELVCVVDAVHVLADLGRDDYVEGFLEGHGEFLTARVLITVTQIEHASTVVLVGWEALSTPDLSMIMAVMSHLNPRGRLRLERVSEPLASTDAARNGVPGWVELLNADFDPHMTDARVSGFRYEHVRPLHPGRLRRLLDRIEAGRFGVVLRSAGFCRLATRPQQTAHWEHVGKMFALAPLVDDSSLRDADELVAVGQDLAIIGVDLRRDALCAALDGAALSDAELAVGPRVWATFADPFPAWMTADDPAD